MNKHIKNYLDSFRLKKEYWNTLLVDAVFFGIISFVFVFLGGLLKQKAYMISQGKTAEELKQMLLSMDPTLAQAFLDNLKEFVITFILGSIVVLVGGVLLYSLSRKLIWDYLLGKKFDKKRYWKWNLINIVLIIPLAIYFFAFGLVKLVLGHMISLLGNQAILDVSYNLINLFFMFSLLVFVFLVYYSFAKEYKVWESIGGAFYLIKSKWKRIRLMFLLVLFTSVVLSLILWPVGVLIADKEFVVAGIGIIVSLLFCAWVRIYVYRTIRE